jgi:predicted nucleic acid-binding protein
MTLIDTNILSDVLHREPDFFAASRLALAAASAQGPLLTNIVVFAELSARFPVRDRLGAVLNRIGIALAPIDTEAAHLAGQAHCLYRQRGGARKAILPDFLIGGHAVSLGAALLTRDTARFASYFPSLTLITP